MKNTTCSINCSESGNELDFTISNNRGYYLFLLAKSKKDIHLLTEAINNFLTAIATHNLYRPKNKYYIAEANLNDAYQLYRLLNNSELNFK